MLMPPEDSQQRQKLKCRVGPHASRPLPVLAHRPAQAVEQPNGQDQLHVLPIPAADLEEQESQVEPQVGNGGAVVIYQTAQVRVGLNVQVLRLEGGVEGQKHFRQMAEQEQGQIHGAESAGEPHGPQPRWERTPGAAPGQQACPEPGPGHAGDEEPDKAVNPRDGDELTSLGVGHQSPIKETRPLHPASGAGHADAHRERQDDPPGGVAARLPAAGLARDEPPGSTPGDAGETGSPFRRRNPSTRAPPRSWHRVRQKARRAAAGRERDRVAGWLTWLVWIG